MAKIRIEKKDGKAHVYTPYNRDFVKNIKQIGGAHWTGSAWSIPEDCIEDARAIMQRVYGETDIAEAEKVTVEVTALDEIREERASVSIFGKDLARAYGRDSGAKVGDDASLISGDIDSGGSARYWDTVVSKGSIFKLRNVVKSKLDEYDKSLWDVKVIEENKPNKESLNAEREKLLARVNEIDKLLKKLEKEEAKA